MLCLTERESEERMMKVRAAMEEVINELTAEEEVKAVVEKEIGELAIKEEQTEIIRELRDLPPAHYIFKIENFSYLSNAKVESYESSDFEVGGYKWRLSLYPKGNKKVNDKNEHVSLYLVLAESNAVPMHKEINVHFKLFVYNQIQDKYLVVQDAKDKVRRFRGAKTEWGFDKLVSLNAFNDASNGYLVDDCCIFGAEIFVMERTSKGECVSIVKELANSYTYTWKIQKFSNCNQAGYTSPVFVIGGYKWSLTLYPNGYSEEKGKCLSMFLHLEDSKPFNSGQKLYTGFILRLRDQLFGVHREQKANNKFCTSANNWGVTKLIPLSDLNDASKGFILDDAVIVEVEITLMTVIKEFS
ncbi:uncharacterized protein LOC110645110 [Hevea brasiliensis]|uniref:uncharacterized protein LOC110645110 n=1 Tax=Hevea brasiliensis TaxID=3981 RepID=UPI0025FEC2EE|nr:uncharacterized protein LOC110645110 [Hevea brasiliensis]